MRNKYLLSDILNVFGIIIIGLITAIFIYPFLHEGAHLITAFIFRADIKEFCLLPTPYVVCNTANLSNIKQSIIGLSGMTFPPIMALIITKRWFWSWYIRFLILGISLLAFLISAFTLILPQGFELNPQDDIIQVINLYKGVKEILVTAILILCVVIVVCIILDKPLEILYRRFNIK